MTRRTNFKQIDVTRALRGAEAAGQKPKGFRLLPDGGIYVELSGGKQITPTNCNQWDADL